jgi:hypothetical protein
MSRSIALKKWIRTSVAGLFIAPVLAIPLLIAFAFSAAFYSEESNARLNGKLPQPELSFIILSAVAMVAVALAALIILAWLNDGGYSHAYLLSNVCALNAGQFIQPLALIHRSPTPTSSAIPHFPGTLHRAAVRDMRGYLCSNAVSVELHSAQHWDGILRSRHSYLERSNSCLALQSQRSSQRPHYT